MKTLAVEFSSDQRSVAVLSVIGETEREIKYEDFSG